MIRAVFMDIDNTLLDFDAAAQEGMAHCFEDAGLIYKPEKDRTGDPDHG